ncbi:hypothetical protein B0H16DRAFT_1461510 [Mycena metata]|uniref:Uncharacterized protein n=1 Tax=Mycena metata TaxID=1033252 RepID=A0AAD7N6C6_9AGAR|nr:hypothetical protein B0H16DRAFT_1461510 [Mycena metata]
MFPARNDSLPHERELEGMQTTLEMTESPRVHTPSPSRMPSLDLERAASPAPSYAPAPRSAGGGIPYFEPLGEADVYDVFELELTLTPGGKEAAINMRYRSVDSSSGRPTYKITKKTRAHFLGKKNMRVTVERSVAWNCLNAAYAAHGEPGYGEKGYKEVFLAKDQPPRSVALTATKDQVLAHTAMGSVVDVASTCGGYDPDRALRRETPAHHFFTLKLNEMGRGAPGNNNSKSKSAAHGTAPRGKRSGSHPSSPLSPSSAPQANANNTNNVRSHAYTGGGHFVFDAAPSGRSDLVSTLYCTGYDQRPVARTGDIAVAELRVRPIPAATDVGSAPAPAWARFFKERHAVLHIARRGLEACMTGPHVDMRLPNHGAGTKGVLSRGQALEVVVAAMGTAVLAVEHEGLQAKRWAWLVQRGAGGAVPVPKPLSLAPMTMPIKPAPIATGVDNNPGLASPSSSGEADTPSSDDSQGPPSGGSLATFHRGRLNSAASTPVPFFARNRGYTPSIADSRRGSRKGSAGSGIEMDEWIAADEAGPPAHPAAAHSPESSSSRVGVCARKGSILSQHSGDEGILGDQHLKAGSWPQKRTASEYSQGEPMPSIGPPSNVFGARAASWMDAEEEGEGVEYIFT